MTTLNRLFCLFAVCLTATVTSPAALMNYGDFSGATIDFIDVTEDNLGPVLLYDVQGTVGDILLIDPKSFGAQKNPGPGTGFIDSELQMMLVAQPGGSIEQIMFSEEGDYTIVGDGNVEANIAYFWQILEVDNIPVTPISGSGTTDFMSSTAGTGSLWSLDFSLDLAAKLVGAGMTGTITKANFKFDNTLTATAADDLSVAFIKKKQIGGVRITVPEPAGLFSALIGLVGLLGFRRR